MPLRRHRAYFGARSRTQWYFENTKVIAVCPAAPTSGLVSTLRSLINAEPTEHLHWGLSQVQLKFRWCLHTAALIPAGIRVPIPRTPPMRRVRTVPTARQLAAVGTPPRTLSKSTLR